MRLTVQKRLASSVLNCSPKKVWIDPERLEEAREAITKKDIADLISLGIIIKKKNPFHSRVRSRLRLIQKRKGRRRGQGSRKGASGARTPKKEHWVTHVRAQRTLIRSLYAQGIVEKSTLKNIIKKIKGGFFRSRRHIKLYLSEHRLVLEKKKPKETQKEKPKETMQ